MSHMPQEPVAGLTSDDDTQETREWREALEAVIQRAGPERAHFLIEELITLAQRTGINLPYNANTDSARAVCTVWMESMIKISGFIWSACCKIVSTLVSVNT